MLKGRNHRPTTQVRGRLDDTGWKLPPEESPVSGLGFGLLTGEEGAEETEGTGARAEVVKREAEEWLEEVDEKACRVDVNIADVEEGDVTAAGTIEEDAAEEGADAVKEVEGRDREGPEVEPEDGVESDVAVGQRPVDDGADGAAAMSEVEEEKEDQTGDGRGACRVEVVEIREDDRGER